MFSSKEFEDGFIKGILYGPQLIGNFYRSIECSVSVAYRFDGTLIGTQIFDKEGEQIK